MKLKTRRVVKHIWTRDGEVLAVRESRRNVYEDDAGREYVVVLGNRRYLVDGECRFDARTVSPGVVASV